MDDILEIIVEFFLEVLEELVKNENIPKYIRYPALVMITILYVGILALMGYVTINFFIEKEIVVGFIMLLITLLLLTLFIIFLKKLKTNAIK